VSEFADKVFLVTGGSRGIGRAVTVALIERGAAVAACARRAEALEALRRSLPGDRLLAVRADVSSPDDLRDFHRAAVERFGRIDGVVSNAGSAVVGPLLEAPDEEVVFHFHARVLACIRLCRLAVPTMKVTGGGSIVHIAGAAGVDPTPGLGIAGVVNAAIQNLSRMMADELAEHHIRVNAVNPGTLDSELGAEVMAAFADRLGLDVEILQAEAAASVPLGRMPVPADVAEAVLFFLSPRSAMITGSSLTPDGGSLIRRLRG